MLIVVFSFCSMAGPIGKADEKVSWASRTDSAHSHSPAASLSSSVANRSQVSETILEETEPPSPPKKDMTLPDDDAEGKEEAVPRRPERPPTMLFSPDHQAADSPQPVTQGEEHKLHKVETTGSDQRTPEASTAPPATGRKAAPWQHTLPRTPTSAPAVLGHPLAGPKASQEVKPKPAAGTLDPRVLIHHPSIPLNPEAPQRAMRDHQREQQGDHESSAVENPGTGEYVDEDNIKRRDMHDSSSGSGPRRTEAARAASSASQSGPPPSFRPGFDPKAGDNPAPQQDQPDDAQWGTPFKVQWIKVGRLPFHRTRHLRNAWNHEREVKVSRDGTELEPGVGQALLDEWDKEETVPLHPEAASPLSDRETSMGLRRGGGTPAAHLRRRTQPTPTSPDRDSGTTHSASAPPRSPFPHRGRGR